MRSRTMCLIGLALLAVAGVISCDRREPYEPPLAERASGSALGSQIRFRDTPRLPVDVPPSPRSIDTLELAIREQGGLATVALKAPESAHTIATGYRPAVAAAQAARALDTVMTLGAEVLDFFDAVNIAMVRIPVDRVRAIHASPFVDFVEPAGPRKISTEVTGWPGDAAGSAPPAVPGGPEAALAEVIPWNVSQVNAPAAWVRTTGAGAKIMIIGSGIGQHYDNPYIVNCGGLAIHATPSSSTAPS